jgi:hypothetical protein
MSDRVRGSAAKTWPKLALALAIGWQAPVVARVAVAKEPSKPAPTATNTPEEALKDFLTAMIENDQAGIQRTALPNPELSLLWQGDKLTPAQKAIAKAGMNPSTFRRLKVGDVVQVPRGPKIVMDEKRINERTQHIVLPDGPLPFMLVKVGNSWKVDASPIIAGRIAAAAVNERHAAAARPKWVAETKLQDQLAADTVIEGLKFRPPAGYRPVNIPIPAGQSSGWIGKRHQDGSFPSIIVIVVAAGADQNRSLSSLLELALPQIQKQYTKNWNQSPVELGRIDNLVGARVRWSGAASVGRKQYIGRKMQGVVYLIAFGRKFVQVMIQEVADDDKTVALCEASALTLRPASDKPPVEGPSAADDKQKSIPRP